MPDYQLPVRNVVDQRFRTNVINGSIVIEMRWSPLNERWYITIDGVTVGRTVVSGEVLGEVSGGFIIAMPLHDNTEPAWNAWGNTHSLMWIELYGSP